MSETNKVELKLLNSIFVNPPKFTIGQIVNRRERKDEIHKNNIVYSVELKIPDRYFSQEDQGEDFAWEYSTLDEHLFGMWGIETFAPSLQLSENYDVEESDLSPSLNTFFDRYRKTPEPSYCCLFRKEVPRFSIGDVVEVPEYPASDERQDYKVVCMITGMQYVPRKIRAAIAAFESELVAFEDESLEDFGWLYFLTILSDGMNGFDDIYGLCAEADIVITSAQEWLS